MFVVRSYSVMDRLAVEVTCWHGSGPAESHLLARQWVESDLSPVDMLAAIAEALNFVAREAAHGAIDLTDDCGM